MWKIPVNALTVSILVACVLVVGGTEQSHIASLLRDYASPQGRPVENFTDAVPLQVGLSLIQIHGLDEAKSSLTMSVFLKMMWHDDFLEWSPAEHGGVKRMAVNSDAVWTPDVELFNANCPPKDMLQKSGRVVIMSDGSAIYVPFLKVMSICPSNPDDDQVTCQLRFGSWVYPASMVALTPMGEYVDTSSYEQNPDWEVLRSSSKVNHKEYDCCPGEKYSDVTFSLTLKRRHKKVQKAVQSGAPALYSVTALLLSACLTALLL